MGRSAMCLQAFFPFCLAGECVCSEILLHSDFVEGMGRVIAEFFSWYPRMWGVRRRLFSMR